MYTEAPLRDHSRCRNQVDAMSLLYRFLAWREARRLRLHQRWLRRSRVILPKPDQRCRRNSVEAVP